MYGVWRFTVKGLDMDLNPSSTRRAAVTLVLLKLQASYKDGLSGPRVYGSGSEGFRV